MQRLLALALASALPSTLAALARAEDEPADAFTPAEVPAEKLPTGDGDEEPSTLDPALRAEVDRLVKARLDALLEERLSEQVDERIDEKLERARDAGYFDQPASPLKLQWRGDFFTKVLIRNNQSGGCVSYGNPAPEGDNFSGDNGFCSELGLTAIGRVSDFAEAGARIQSRWGMQWADWYENGDLKEVADGSGESLGMNHAGYLQLRGIYLRVAPPIPTVHYIHLGASDLSMFNPWTVGKLRFTERDNGRGFFIDGSLGDWLSYTGARLALPKLFASANYNTGIDDPLIQNPFWERDEAWALKLRSELGFASFEAIGSWVRDFEADLDDPDAIGSTNRVDTKDGVVITIPRYQNVNTTFEVSSNWIDWLGLKALVGYSWSKTSPDLVFNAVSGSQGFTPVPMGEHHGYAVVTRANFYDPLDLDLELNLEYFNIGDGWVSVFGTRREADVLLTDGFLDGQLPTLNVANEFQDFTEPFYESIIGWHGATAVLTWAPGDLTLSGEGTFIEYNTDTGEGTRDTDKVYPDFLYTDGMTDTELYTFANTNDRGRDPRSVYHEHQNRMTLIGVAKASYDLDLLGGLTFRVKHKTIFDRDLRNLALEGDDYLGLLFFNKASVEASVTDELGVALGYQLDYWVEKHRSGEVIAGVPDYPDYNTLRHKAFLDVRYVFGGVSLWYHLEYLNKDVDTTDDQLDFYYRHIVRSIAMVSASF